jgi:hypothetical protein
LSSDQRVGGSSPSERASSNNAYSASYILIHASGAHSVDD